MTTIILLGIVFLVWEIRNFISPQKLDDEVTNVSKELKSGKLNSDSRGYILINLSYFAWTIFGLFTPLWPAYIVLILISILSVNYTKSLSEDRMRVIVRRVDAGFCILIISIIFYLQFWQ